MACVRVCGGCGMAWPAEHALGFAAAVHASLCRTYPVVLRIVVMPAGHGFATVGRGMARQAWHVGARPMMGTMCFGRVVMSTNLHR